MNPPARRKKVERTAWSEYRRLARAFREAASLAMEFEYWNAAGVLIVHSAIAVTDAICIRIGGVKSAGDDHYQAGNLVGEVVALDREGTRALDHYFAIIQEKSIVSYGGKTYRQHEIAGLMRHLDRYQQWADRMLAE
ncbi:MAG: hypothetical protein PHN82_04515 [bacterium]|nr:hypothetical protein [bacterium]